MRRSSRVLLLISTLILLLTCGHGEEVADELSRVKTTIRECRSDLNNLEVAKDRCTASQKEFLNKIKELEIKIHDLSDHEHLLLVRPIYDVYMHTMHYL